MSDAAASRRLSWRQPLHDLGLQVAMLEVGVKLARRAWQGREVLLDPEGWELMASAILGADVEEVEQASC